MGKACEKLLEQVREMTDEIPVMVKMEVGGSLTLIERRLETEIDTRIAENCDNIRAEFEGQQAAKRSAPPPQTTSPFANLRQHGSTYEITKSVGVACVTDNGVGDISVSYDTASEEDDDDTIPQIASVEGSVTWRTLEHGSTRSRFLITDHAGNPTDHQRVKIWKA